MVSGEEVPLKTEKNAEEIKGVPKKKTLREKIRYIKENVTLEPTLACYIIPGVLSRLATQNLNLDKVCRVNKNYTDAVCDALVQMQGTEYTTEEKSIQELIAAMESWKNVLLTVIPSCLILFLGAWSDKTGKRKICILLPIFGELLVCLSYILNVYYFKELPAQVAVFFEAFFPAITGGWISTYMGAFSYISDISSEETRTYRVGIANLCLTAGGPIGSALSGILLRHIGYYGVFGLSALMYMFSIVYGFVYIKDPERPKLEKTDTRESPGVCGFLKSFFDVKHVKDTLQVTFKKGPNHRRTKSILVLASIAFIYGPSYGEFTNRYLFCRYRFNWDALKYSFYHTFYICIHFVGALISINLFSRRLKWDDSVLGIISSVSKMVGGLATGFAQTGLHMYLAVAVEMFNATSFTALRSISSKLVSSDELGKMTAVFNLMEVLTSMVFGPLYSWIYKITLNVNVGITYYLSTVLTIAPLLIFSWFYKQRKKRNETGVNEESPSFEDNNRRKPSLFSSIENEAEISK